jgi:hypothetical protein
MHKFLKRGIFMIDAVIGFALMVVMISWYATWYGTMISRHVRIEQRLKESLECSSLLDQTFYRSVRDTTPNVFKPYSVTFPALPHAFGVRIDRPIDYTVCLMTLPTATKNNEKKYVIGFYNDVQKKQRP